MKKILFFCSMVMFIFFFAGCKKSTPSEDYKCTSCKTTPDALPENNNISKGVYKGVVIGSTGTIQFNIANGSSTINAVMVLDGVTVNLTSDITWHAGSAYIAPFNGTYNGGPISVHFYVNADGSNPQVVTSNIPGHPSAVFIIEKEQSNFLIECFEGTYSSTAPETGTFNLLVARALGLMGGASRKTGSAVNEDIDGTVSSDGTLYIDSQAVGKIVNDTMSGSFKDHNNATVTFQGKRTL